MPAQQEAHAHAMDAPKETKHMPGWETVERDEDLAMLFRYIVV